MSLNLYLEYDPCPHCGLAHEGWSTNITHNLGLMAKEAGVYQILWRPTKDQRASHMIEPLRAAIEEMKADPERFKAFDTSNGWGTYAQFLPWLQDVLFACTQERGAKVRASV